MITRSKVGAVALMATLLSGTAFAQATAPASDQAPPPSATNQDTAPLQKNAPQNATKDTTGTPSQSAATPSEATAPLSERKMDQFVNAYVAVQTIQQSAIKDVQATQDPKKVEEVKSKAETEMVAAVERSGLAITEFNSIVQTMQVDEGVRSQIAAKVQERVGAPVK